MTTLSARLSQGAPLSFILRKFTTLLPVPLPALGSAEQESKGLLPWPALINLQRFQPQTHKAFCKLPGLRKTKGKALTCQNQHKDITSRPVKSWLRWHSWQGCCFLSHCPAPSRCFCFLELAGKVQSMGKGGI